MPIKAPQMSKVAYTTFVQPNMQFGLRAAPSRAAGGTGRRARLRRRRGVVQVLALALLSLRVGLSFRVRVVRGGVGARFQVRPSILHRRADAEEGAAPRAVVRQPV